MTDAVLIEKTACTSPDCNSSDAMAVYDDGHTYCFSCNTSGNSDGEIKSRPKGKSKVNVISSVPFDKTIRGISPTTFKKWGYGKGKLRDGRTVHLANHYKDGRLVGQKIRGKDKKFGVNGKLEPLYGMWLWNKKQSKKIVITEGEIDALTVSQVQDHKWPVVSLSNGAASAEKTIRQAIDYLESFEEVILMFDMDEVGQEAAKKAAQLFSPGKCKIAKLSEKDPNELLKLGRGHEVVKAIWNAEEYRPDDIVTLDSVINDVLTPVEMGISWPWPTLTSLTYGRREGENYYFGAGTGFGKTAIIAEIVYHDSIELGVKCGGIYLEQAPQETFRRLAGLIGKKKFHKPMDAGGWTLAELKESVSKIPEDKIFLYDSRGSTDWDILKQRIRFMVVNQGCKHIFIDNLTGITTKEGEREGLERVVREINSLGLELGIIIHIVSHLATPEGKSHEEGGKVLPKHFRGSRVIMFYANYIIGGERNQLADNEDERNLITIRIGKDRNTGEATGQTFNLKYSHDTGRIIEYEPEDTNPFQDETEDDPF